MTKFDSRYDLTADVICLDDSLLSCSISTFAMALLSDIIFSLQADLAYSGNGWLIPEDTSINAKAGNDEITGSGLNDNPGIEIRINSSLFLGSGSDILRGTSGQGYGIFNNGTINAMSGDDIIYGQGRWGIYNGGEINTGLGDDSITGIGSGTFDGAIINKGLINTGAGNDKIIATGSRVNPAFINDGVIDTGEGADTITGWDGGFWGSGKVFLGRGSDTLIGTCTNGTVDFDGGQGKDRILLENNERYLISNNPDGSLAIRNELVSFPEGRYNNFELVGGRTSEVCIPLREGTIEIDGAGIPRYI